MYKYISFNSCLIVLAFFWVKMLSGQIGPLQYEFAEVDPVWVHTVVDTSFNAIPGQPLFTQNSSQYITSVIFDDGHLFLLSTSIEKVDFSTDVRGYILENIDISNGESVWNQHNTKDTDGDKDLYRHIGLSASGNIELLGVESYGPEDGSNWSFGGYHSKASLKYLDPDTGDLLAHVSAQDSISVASLPCGHYQLYPLSQDSLFLVAIMIGEDVGIPSSPIYDYGVTYKVLDRNLDVMDTYRHLFDFNDLGAFSISQPAYIDRLDDHTLISVALKDRFLSLDNPGLQLMWTDISDPFEITSPKIIDYKDLVPGSDQTLQGFRFKCIGNTIFLGHQIS